MSTMPKLKYTKITVNAIFNEIQISILCMLSTYERKRKRKFFLKKKTNVLTANTLIIVENSMEHDSLMCH